MSAPLKRMVQFLDDQNPRPLTEDEAVPVPIERPAGLLRRVISPAHCPERIKTSENKRGDAGVTAARDKQDLLSQKDLLACLDYRVGTGCAGGRKAQ
jgi:hypothetical protein